MAARCVWSSRQDETLLNVRHELRHVLSSDLTHWECEVSETHADHLKRYVGHYNRYARLLFSLLVLGFFSQSALFALVGLQAISIEVGRQLFALLLIVAASVLLVFPYVAPNKLGRFGIQSVLRAVRASAVCLLMVAVFLL